MTEVSKRVKQIRQSKNISQLIFAESLGVTRAHISRVETSAVGISKHLIKAICREYGIREEWLREGKGPIESQFIVPDLDSATGKELHQYLRRVSYQDGAEKLRLGTAMIHGILTLTKNLKDLMVISDNPEAIEFLKAKRRFQRAINRLYKLFPPRQPK